MSKMYTEERRFLLDFFRTQINTHAQIIASIMVALFTQGIVTSFFPEEYAAFKIPFFLSGLGFFGSFAVVQYGKVFWNARLWNAALVAKPKTFEKVYGKSPTQEGIEETGISRVYLGIIDSMVEACKPQDALLIFLGKEMKYELSFSVLAAVLLASGGCLLESQSCETIFPFLSTSLLFVIFLVVLVLVVVVPVSVYKKKCCSASQLQDWLRSDDLERLAFGKAFPRS